MKIELKIPDVILGVEKGLIKIFLLPFSLVVVFLLSLNLVIIPKINEIGEVNKKIKSVEGQTRTVVEKKNYLLSVDKEQLKQNSDYMESALLKDKQSYYLVGVVRSIADKYGFQVKSFSISPGELKSEDTIKIANTEVLNKVPVDMVLVGRKEKHIELLLALEKSLPVLKINNMDIKNVDEISELKINISSFYMTNVTSSNISNLTLNELILKKEEQDLLGKLSQFEKVGSQIIPVSTESGDQFTRYQRSNPFSL